MEPYQAVFKRKEVKYLLTEAQLFALRPGAGSAHGAGRFCPQQHL